MEFPIYLDNNSTTRTDPRVVQAMLPYFDCHYGNPSSTSHSLGWVARQAVEDAVAMMAECLGAESREIVITSGATEAVNLALKGSLPYLQRRGNHIISCLAEHKAGIDPLLRLQKQGWEVTFLKPDNYGRISAGKVLEAVTAQTVLVSIMFANNEIGTIHPLSEIAEICHQRKILFHTDATQAVGKIPVQVDRLGVDLLSFSAHKFYGPKGVGGLFVRRRDRPVRLVPQIEGGGHQHHLRSGTLPVPLIAGMAEAMKLAVDSLDGESQRLSKLRDDLENRITQGLPGTAVNGPSQDRLPNTLNVRFDGVSGEALMLAMKQVAVSSGSACSSADPEPSHVLKSIGLTDDQARSSLRFSLGRFNTSEEIQKAAELVIATVRELRYQHQSIHQKSS